MRNTILTPTSYKQIRLVHWNTQNTQNISKYSMHRAEVRFMVGLLLGLANEKNKQKMNPYPKNGCAPCKYPDNKHTVLCTHAHVAIQFCMALQLSSPIRAELIVYKTSSDTINYVNYRHSDADSGATDVVFLPLIHLSSPSYYLFLLPHCRLSLLLPVTALNPVLSQRIHQRHALKPEAARGRVCVCVWLCSRVKKRERERAKVVLYSTENSHLSSEWCCIKAEADKQGANDSRDLDLNPRERAGFG